MIMARKFGCAAALALVVITSAAFADAADPLEERNIWRAQITAAKARALEARQKALADFARAKAEPRLPPSSPDLELARRNSAAVLKDPSLRYGDVVTTMGGMFVFKGQSGREPRADFEPVLLYNGN